MTLALARRIIPTVVIKELFTFRHTSLKIGQKSLIGTNV